MADGAEANLSGAIERGGKGVHTHVNDYTLIFSKQMVGHLISYAVFLYLTVAYVIELLSNGE